MSKTTQCEVDQAGELIHRDNERCACGRRAWVGAVEGIIHLGYAVICKKCYTMSKTMPTKELAIAEWNNGIKMRYIGKWPKPKMDPDNRSIVDILKERNQKKNDEAYARR